MNKQNTRRGNTQEKINKVTTWPDTFLHSIRLFNASGFTLIELLVVVLIIGILAAVALPQYRKTVEKARMTEAITIVSSLEKAVDMYLLEHGWPPEGTVVEFLGNSPHSNPDWSDENTTYLNPPLDIDVTGPLTCTYTPEDDGVCYSSSYTYYAKCSQGTWMSDGCFILADRVTSQQGIYNDEDPTKTPYVISSGTISSHKTTPTGSWIHECSGSFYDNNRDINKKLCQSLWKN